MAFQNVGWMTRSLANNTQITVLNFKFTPHCESLLTSQSVQVQPSFYMYSSFYQLVWKLLEYKAVSQTYLPSSIKHRKSCLLSRCLLLITKLDTIETNFPPTIDPTAIKRKKNGKPIKSSSFAIQFCIPFNKCINQCWLLGIKKMFTVVPEFSVKGVKKNNKYGI